MGFELKIDAASIVLRGPFKPNNFHPGWFSSKGLVRPEDLNECQIEIIQADISIFLIDWVRFVIDKDRFEVQAKNNAHFEQLRDLVVGTLTVSEDTQIRAMGLNRDMHFLASSFEIYNAIGDNVAPKDVWKELNLDKLGLRTMTMESKRDTPPGHIWIKLEPSNMFGEEFGIRVEANNHYSNEEKRLEEIISILQSRWKSDMDRALTLANGILKSTPSV